MIDLEYHILQVFGFDFNFPGPVQSMERFLRILDYDLNKTIYDMYGEKGSKKYGDNSRKKLEKFELDKLPLYIQNNLEKFKEWIDWNEKRLLDKSLSKNR